MTRRLDRVEGREIVQEVYHIRTKPMPHTQYVVLWLCIRARRPFYSLYTEAHVKGLLNANLDALVLVLLERSSCSGTYWKLVVIVDYSSS